MTVKEHLNRKIWKGIAITASGFLVMFLISAYLEPLSSKIGWEYLIGVVIVGAGFVYTYAAGHCPYCQAPACFIGAGNWIRRVWIVVPDNCPHCGRSFNSDISEP